MSEMVKMTAESLLVAWMAASCAWLQDDSANLGKPRADTEAGKGKSGQENGKDTAIYVTALEFPSGYDWKRDTLKGEVDCRLVLLENGIRKLEIPARYDNQVSSDPDMHRVIDGHLYADYATDAETIISKDGKEIFRYQGREMISGFKVSGNDIYTLGRNRSKVGFSYRKNGKEIMSRAKGRIIGDYYNSAYPDGALYSDSGHLYFSYYADDVSGDGVERHYFLVQDRVETPVDVDDGYGSICDMRMVGGKLCRLFINDARPTCIDVLMGDAGYRIENLAGVVSNAYFIGDADELMVAEIFSIGDYGFSMMSLWNRSERVGLFVGNASLYLSGLNVCSVEMSGGFALSYRLPKETVPFRDSCYFISSHCATFKNGHFYMAVTPAGENGKPRLIIDKESRILDVSNGFATSVSVFP